MPRVPPDGVSTIADEEDGTIVCCVGPASLSHLIEPVEVGEFNGPNAGRDVFWDLPLLGPLLFENQTSDARDHCANERTFLSYLRLSIYMAIVSVAIVLSFHLKRKATDAERRMARPLGVIFWILSVACLGVGAANYIKTINKYSKRQALVQTGWKTQSVMGIVALCIFGSCVALLVINRQSEAQDEL